jgi:glycosyltransferase involved in cell wall biosynthesis
VTQALPPRMSRALQTFIRTAKGRKSEAARTSPFRQSTMGSSADITIARVIARLNIGGPAIQAILMTEAFLRKGYRSLLLTGEVPSGEGSMEYLARDRGVVPISISTMSRRISWYDDLTALWELVRIFYREKPVVVHTHTAKAGTLGRLAAMAAGVPVRIHTFHGHVFRGYFSPFVTRLFLGVERFLARHTDCVIAISQSQKRELVDVYRIAPAEKVSVIPLGIDLGPFLGVEGRNGMLRTSLGCDAETFLVGWVGRLTPIKDPDLFLACARHLVDGSGTIRFALIGDGELREQCETKAAEPELRLTVSLTGWRQHLERIYADLDVVVLSSINEGTPVSLLEVMASGRPFVSTDVGGVRDLMIGPSKRQGEFEVFDNGILVPRNPEVMADAVAYLMENPGMRCAMGQAGRRFVRSRFSSERLADDLEFLYLSLAHSKRKVPVEAQGLGSGSSAERPECAPVGKGLP